VTDPVIIGWDIGGAHVKAAKIDVTGRLLQVELHACPLWLGLEQLHTAVAQVQLAFKCTPAQHVITMTGELVDLFANREQGVREILAVLATLLGEQIYVFAGAKGILPLARVETQHYLAIASANWLATATFAAQHRPQGMLVDIGSTTSDLLLFKQGEVCVSGYSDFERLRSGELIYTGVIRTAVMAVAQQAYFQGQMQELMAEYFATMADVYRLTGELQEQHDQTATADGTEKTPQASARRLARMTGYDFIESDMPVWQEFARQLRQKQWQKLLDACTRQLSRVSMHAPCLIGAGVGRFLVQDLAQYLSCEYIDFATLLQAETQDLQLAGSDCAPAVALVCMFAQK
jgi:(4-(4-[2-(gamma-L-glutamylamino)ethyl]phenoxymethyl)furan-2-yl)methanamine synthase